MLDMRRKGLERLIRMSQVSAQGDAAFLVFCLVKYPTASPKTLARVELESQIGRVAGRVAGNPSTSATVDQLMRCTQSCSANGSDREEFELCEGRCSLCHHLPFGENNL